MTTVSRPRTTNASADSALPAVSRALGALAAFLAVSFLASGCAGHRPPAKVQGEPAPPQDTATGGDPAASGRPDRAAPGFEYLEVESGPDDGRWLVDDQGREYYTVAVEKKPEYSIRGDRVMLPPGVAYDLAEEREEAVLVKIYNPESLPEAVPETKGLDRAALFEDLDGFRVDAVDRLSFSSFGRGLPARGQWRQNFEIVDIDGDGHLDIVHGPPRKSNGQPRIFLGNGAGTWRPWTRVRFEGPPLDYGGVAVADFNGDGHQDVALAVHLRGLIVFTGDGQGVFRRWGEGLPYWVPGGAEQPPPYSSRAVEAVDWNRDGRVDLLTLGEGPRIQRRPQAATPDFSFGDRGPILFLNRGGGEWERYDQGTGREHLFGDDLATGDFDGDGLTDFALASRVAGATRLVKLGREDGSWEDVSLSGLVRPGTFGAVHAADLDGDGKEEILLGYVASDEDDVSWTGIDLIEHGPDGWRRVAVVAEQGELHGVTAIASGDLDGDAHTDLVALTGTGERWVLLGTEDPTVFRRDESPEIAPSVAGCQGYGLAIETLPESGRPFVVMGFAGEPGSEQIFSGMTKRCPTQGSLEAWRPAPAE